MADIKKKLVDMILSDENKGRRYYGYIYRTGA